MWNTPAADQLSKIPRLYETEHIPAEEKLIRHEKNRGILYNAHLLMEQAEGEYIYCAFSHW